MNTLTLAVITIAISQAITACSTPQNAQNSAQGHIANNSAQPYSLANTLNDQPQALIEQSSFPIDTLYSLLVAEVAASRQHFDITLEHYIEQANITQDKHITARAARIAQFFRAEEKSLAMGLMWLKHEPDNIEANTLVANAYIELKQPIKALDYTEKLFKHQAIEDKRDVAALTETIANFSKNVDKSTANTLIKRYKVLSQQYPTLSGLKVGLSILYQNQGLLTEATDWITLALTENPTKTSAITQEILLLQQGKHIELAVQKLENHLSLAPNNRHLRLLYARLLTQTNITEAYEQFTQLSEQSPTQLDLKFSRALLAIELKKISIAKPLFNELLSTQYRPKETHFYLGHIEELLQQLDDALGHYQAVTSGNNLLYAQKRIGRILIAQNRVGDARNTFDQLRHNYPKKTEQFYADESELLIQHQHLDNALALLNHAIEQHPDSHHLHYHRATIHEQQNQLTLMESDFRHILTIDPNNVNALNGLGYFLAKRTERYAEARQLIKQALTLRPQDAAIIDSMGWVSFKMGNIEEALRYLRQAFALLPDPEVAAHLGEALWVSGKQEEAKIIWRESLKRHPETHFIEETLERLGISL